MKAPFPYFGGKSAIAADVWERFGAPKQYIEPFCGSAAMLLAAPRPASLEVVCDSNGFIANFWRAVKHRPGAVAEWADYPVSHVDLGARHVWLVAQTARIGAELQDADWPGDAKAAGWWLWGQCCWIGSGWCDGNPQVGAGQIPHAGDAGRGVQAVGRIPHVSDAGRALWTSSGRAAWTWLHQLAGRLERVRIVHGDWERCLNHHYGGADTAVFLDPPYRSYESVYGSACSADRAAAWAAAHQEIRVALCGHVGDYELPGWDAVAWDRGRYTYGGNKTTDKECIWYSPACPPAAQRRLPMGER